VQTDTPTFGYLLRGTILIIGALLFLPIAVSVQIAEHLGPIPFVGKIFECTKVLRRRRTKLLCASIDDLASLDLFQNEFIQFHRFFTKSLHLSASFLQILNCP